MRLLVRRALLASSLIFLLTGCGVFHDYARDHQIHLFSLGVADFISPVKLKMAVIPFTDEAGLGTPEAGPNISRLLTEEFNRRSELLTLPAGEVARAVAIRGYTYPLSPEQVIQLGRDLNANIIVEGAIAQLDQHSQRKGWRKIIRYFTKQQRYVEAMLLVTIYDASNGVVLASRANSATYKFGGSPKKDPFVTTTETPPPPQEAIEESLDMAISEAYHRSLDGLAALPFKAQVTERVGEKTVAIAFGTEVGLSKGEEFAYLPTQEVLTNAINVPYQIPGAPKAHLRVTEVTPGRSVLEIIDGEVHPGEYIETWDN
ncbi:MAG: DUF4136 domain-containing protein [Deltaproteobacteria bacterium]|jgi:hypothetical protein|nr:DUF4136 domain-containing protein [Deltaproteobacteria bacterium]